VLPSSFTSQASPLDDEGIPRDEFGQPPGTRGGRRCRYHGHRGMYLHDREPCAVVARVCWDVLGRECNGRRKPERVLVDLSTGVMDQQTLGAQKARPCRATCVRHSMPDAATREPGTTPSGHHVMCPVRPALQGSVEKLIERPTCNAIAQKSMAGSPCASALVREEREGEYHCARAGLRQLRESARGVRGQNARDPRLGAVREASSDSLDTLRPWNPSIAHECENYHRGLARSPKAARQSRSFLGRLEVSLCTS